MICPSWTLHFETSAELIFVLSFIHVEIEPMIPPSLPMDRESSVTVTGLEVEIQGDVEDEFEA